MDEFNQELERGDTYPLEVPMTIEQFTKYWFGTFAAVMFMGGKEETSNLLEERDWTTQCLGTFYIKPNYPGKRSHWGDTAQNNREILTSVIRPKLPCM